MKRYILKTALLALLAGSMNSCIEETYPSSTIVTADQLPTLSSGTTGLTNAILGCLGDVGATYSGQNWDLGYPGLGMIRDIHCSDFPPYSVGYEQFWYFNDNTYLGGNYVTVHFPWKFYYQLIGQIHNVLRLPYNEDNRGDFGLAHFYRAWAYFDMARWYEYKKTGVAELDDEAAENGVYGLTVPIFDETITEAQARNTPRAPFYEIYRFILDDLDEAETMLTGVSRLVKNHPELSTVYGFKARFYLELASRFKQAPEDLTALLASGSDWGFTTTEQCYALAAEYARLAISRSGATPLSESEWYGGSSYTNGFNSVNSNAWMLGIILTKESLSSYDWKNFIGHVSPEQSWGIGGIVYSNGKYSNDYKTQRCISSYLFDRIDDDDWRKVTWVAPEDAGLAPEGKYKTAVPDNHFKVIPPYASFKFRPVNGERDDYSVGAAADYPLMRVEEMYFIEAEALAGSQGVAAGVVALKSFINTYRRHTNGSYNPSVASEKEFIDELMIQKRIEFWGEGIIFWDYKRLNLQVLKGYEGTNFPDLTLCLNSYEGYCAPWLIAFIPRDEYLMNPAIIPNPDCSSSIPAWNGN